VEVDAVTYRQANSRVLRHPKVDASHAHVRRKRRDGIGARVNRAFHAQVTAQGARLIAYLRDHEDRPLKPLYGGGGNFFTAKVMAVISDAFSGSTSEVGKFSRSPRHFLSTPFAQPTEIAWGSRSDISWNGSCCHVLTGLNRRERFCGSHAFCMVAVRRTLELRSSSGRSQWNILEDL
jgi:hypothetical protein